MLRIARFVPAAVLALAAACSSERPVCCGPSAAVRVINAYTTPVDVVIDGNVAAAGVAAGVIDTVRAAPGAHTLVLRPTSGAASVSQSIELGSALSTVAAVRASSGSVATAVLDDTNSVVPAGATKVRVIHLAPNAGTLQVYRTQPDYQSPVQWQFPFNYQPEPTSLSAPFVQSTVGSWEIRIWQTPTDSSGWSSAPTRVVLDLKSGEKKTVLMLDDGKGGVRIELL